MKVLKVISPILKVALERVGRLSPVDFVEKQKTKNGVV